MGAHCGWMRMVRRVEWGVWGVNRKTTKETLSSKYSSTKWTVLLSNTKVNYCKYKPTSFSSQLKLMFAQHSPPFNQLEFKKKTIEKISKYQKHIFTNFKCPEHEYDWRQICWGKRSLLVNLLHPPLTEPNLGNFVQLQISSWQLYLPVRCRNTFLSYSSPALALAGGWWGQNRKIVQFREEGTNIEQQWIRPSIETNLWENCPASQESWHWKSEINASLIIGWNNAELVNQSIIIVWAEVKNGAVISRACLAVRFPSGKN